MTFLSFLMRMFLLIFGLTLFLYSAMERAHENMETTNVNQESVSELFGATLDCISDSASNAMKKSSEFLGKLCLPFFLRIFYLFPLTKCYVFLYDCDVCL